MIVLFFKPWSTPSHSPLPMRTGLKILIGIHSSIFQERKLLRLPVSPLFPHLAPIPPMTPQPRGQAEVECAPTDKDNSTSTSAIVLIGGGALPPRRERSSSGSESDEEEETGIPTKSTFGRSTSTLHKPPDDLPDSTRANRHPPPIDSHSSRPIDVPAHAGVVAVAGCTASSLATAR
jgi:hypothetical protein